MGIVCKSISIIYLDLYYSHKGCDLYMVEKRRIGIIGGTFNPIHLGHLMIAEVARESFHLEKVIFVPARIPPHKHNDVIDAKHRYAMTAAAVADNPYFEISDVEMRREGPSYTIDTIHHFKKIYGDSVSFYFIAGTDTILELLGPKAKNRIHLMNVPEMKLSATYLRDRLRHGLTVRYMLPKCVVQYIEKYDIYRKE